MRRKQTSRRELFELPNSTAIDSTSKQRCYTPVSTPCRSASARLHVVKDISRCCVFVLLVMACVPVQAAASNFEIV